MKRFFTYHSGRRGCWSLLLAGSITGVVLARVPLTMAQDNDGGSQGTAADSSTTQAPSGAAAVSAELPAPESLEAVPGDPQPIAADEVEPLARGPVHEAFAEPVQYDSKPGQVVAEKPPEPIDEIPPDSRPAGDDYTWIPGYWAWDDADTRYVWVSGVWRDAPPDRRWVPGYWTEVDGGYQWVAGTWVPVDETSLSYLPEPPENLDRGPTGTAPADDFFWVPGCWMWQDQRYAWRPGYWSQGQANWIWVPNRYLYTPRGYLFVRGYWDYQLARRGWLFSPVVFPRGYNQLYGQSYYVPRNIVDAALLTTALFVNPRYNHYYYGDFYGSRYNRLGYRPWFDYHMSYAGYEPFFAYDYWRYGRGNRDWYDQMARRYRDNGYRGRDDDEWERSNREVARELTQHRHGDDSQYLSNRGLSDRDGNHRQFVKPLEDQIADDPGKRTQRLRDDQRQEIARQTQRSRTISEDRRGAESARQPTVRYRPNSAADQRPERRGQSTDRSPADYQSRSFRLPEQSRTGDISGQPGSHRRSSPPPPQRERASGGQSETSGRSRAQAPDQPNRRGSERGQRGNARPRDERGGDQRGNSGQASRDSRGGENRSEKGNRGGGNDRGSSKGGGNDKGGGKGKGGGKK
ncbi:MAG: hypothetical protein R3C10_13690 [Pirellulales bacterium]